MSIRQKALMFLILATGGALSLGAFWVFKEAVGNMIVWR